MAAYFCMTEKTFVMGSECRYTRLIFFVLYPSGFGQICFLMSWIGNLLCLGLCRLLRQFLCRGVVPWRCCQGLLPFDSGWCVWRGWLIERGRLLFLGFGFFLLRLLLWRVHCKWYMDVLGELRRQLILFSHMRLRWWLIRGGHWLHFHGYWVLIGHLLFIKDKVLGYHRMLGFCWYFSRKDVWSISFWDWLAWS